MTITVNNGVVIFSGECMDEACSAKCEHWQSVLKSGKSDPNVDP